MKKVPKRYAHVLFAFLMSMSMACIMSGILTALLVGFADFFTHWLHAFLLAWVIAFPAIMVVAPAVKKVADRLTETSG